jgi:mRNA-degrading endonuclease RelE of RelBE toxin-antitoxin system
VKITFSPAAIAAIDSLSERDQKAIRRSIDRIASLELKILNQVRGVRKLHGLKEKADYYSLRASRDLRVILQYTEGGIVILDVARYSTIEKLLKGSTRSIDESV